MLKISSYLMIIALFVGCQNLRDNRKINTEKPNGVKLKVVKLVGDFTVEPPMGEYLAEISPIHIFKGRVEPFEKPNPSHRQLIKIIKPDKNGHYKISLEPGEYTFVIEIDHILYLNTWADDGSWGTIIVKRGQWSDYVIENVLEATF